MDREIKRLLKLARIPNFRLTPEEEFRLNEWKNAQEKIEIKKPKRVYSRKKNPELEPNIRLDDLKVTNEVKAEDKFEGETVGDIEVES